MKGKVSVGNVDAEVWPPWCHEYTSDPDTYTCNNIELVLESKAAQEKIFKSHNQII